MKDSDQSSVQFNMESKYVIALALVSVSPIPASKNLEEAINKKVAELITISDNAPFV